MTQVKRSKYSIVWFLFHGMTASTVLVGCGPVATESERTEVQSSPAPVVDEPVSKRTPSQTAEETLAPEPVSPEATVEKAGLVEDSTSAPNASTSESQPAHADREDAQQASGGGEVSQDSSLTKLTGVARLQQLGAKIERGAEDRVIGVDLNDTQVTDAELVHLAGLADLKSLNLSRTAVTDEGLREIANLRRLKFLYLYGAEVTDEGVKHLAELGRLEVLCLDDTRITDKSLKLLGEMKRLEKLHVQTRATMSDEGLGHLVELRRLFELRIPYSEISDDAVKALTARLPRCKVLRPETKPTDEPEPTD